jgi:hypothetical protein
VRYILMIWAEPAALAGPGDGADRPARNAAFGTFTAELRGRGVLRSSEHLGPAATRVQVWGGDVLTAPARSPPAAWSGTVEIRPAGDG